MNHRSVSGAASSPASATVSSRSRTRGALFASAGGVAGALLLSLILGVLVGMAGPGVAAAQTPAVRDTSAAPSDRASSDRASPDSLGPLRTPNRSAPDRWSSGGRLADPMQGGPQRRSRRSDDRQAPAALPPAPDVDPPNLIERYRSARNRVLAQRVLLEGRRGVRPLPLDRIPTPSDSLRPRPADPVATAKVAEDTTAFAIGTVHTLSRLERGWFQQTFAGTEWSFLGSGRYFTIFDTTATRELRARLQAQYGAPTQELADFDLRRGGTNPPDDYVQFEYWFVVNDSIPVKVMDAGGPRDRGLIVAADQSVRDRLYALRQALLHPLRRPDRDPYVDYWYEEDTRRWYRTGYDGSTYFTERVYRSQMEPGRPSIDSDRGRVAE